MPTITIKNKKLHYVEAGQGFPIIFAHSFLWDQRMWQAQFEELAQSYRCISIDMWAHGQSDTVEGPVYTIEQLAEDYWVALRTLGIEECAFFGLSVGGMIGAHLALHHPGCIKILCLADTYLGAEPEPSRSGYTALLNKITADASFTEEMIETIVPFFFAPQSFETKPEIIDAFREDLAKRPTEMLAGIIALGRGILVERNSILDQFPNIQTPTLVMVGEHDGPRPPAESREMAELLPNARLVVVPDAGHIASVEQPEFVSNVLTSYLEQTLNTRAIT